MAPLPPVDSRTPLLASRFENSYSPSPGPSRPFSSRAVPSSLHVLRRRRHSTIHFLPAFFTFVLLFIVAFLAWDVSSFGNCYFAPVCRMLGDGRERMGSVWWRDAGAYAPWKSLGSGGGKRGLPRGCEINQVNLLHRHAARYPTKHASQYMRRSLDKIANRTVRVPRHHSELAFLSRADLGMTGWKFDLLMDQGRKAAWRSGREMGAIYRHLIDNGDGLFSRSSGGTRVVESAGYWLEGFRGNPFKMKRIDELEQANVTIPEGGGSNNSLSVHNCPAFENQPVPDVSGLSPFLQPALDRLNNVLDPQPNLDFDDIIYLADMCAYDSQAMGEDWEAWSRWCGIFIRQEWEGLGHIKDAKRYYEVGEGSTYGSTMGAGWVNELIARLTDSEPRDATCTNRTLDSDETTFPRGGKRFFVDFGHDNEMIATLAAMGVMSQQRPLPTDSIPSKRTFLISNIIPFGSRIVFERLGCQLGNWEPDPEGGGDENLDGRKNYLRIFVNDVLQTVDHTACKQSGFVEHGMCEVELFVESQAWATTDVDWGVCYKED